MRHFRLLLWNCWTEFNETWQKARSQLPLPSLCFGADRKNNIAAPVSDWLRHFRLFPWNSWTEFSEAWQEARSQRPLPSLCFSGDRKNKIAALASDWMKHFRLLIWNRWTKFNKTWEDAHLKPLNWIQQNLTGSKISTSSTEFVFVGPIGETRSPPWSLIGWDIFDFSSETAKRNSTKLHKYQDFNVLYQVIVFRGDRKKKQDSRPDIWSAEKFSTSLKPLNEFQGNLVGSKISITSTKFVFSGRSGKQDCRPVRSVNKGCTLNPDALYVALLAPCCHYVSASVLWNSSLFSACGSDGEEEDEDEERIEELSEDLSDCRNDLSEPDPCPTCPTCEDCDALLVRLCMAYSPTNSLQDCTTCLNLGVANCDLSTCEVVGTDPFDFCVPQPNVP